MQNILEQEHYQFSIMLDYEETKEALVSIIYDASTGDDDAGLYDLFPLMVANSKDFIEVLSNPSKMKNLIESIDTRIRNFVDFAILVSGINNSVFGTNSQYNICIKSGGVIKNFKMNKDNMSCYINIDNQYAEEISIFKLDCTHLSPRINMSKTESNMKFNEDVYPNYVRMMTTLYWELSEDVEKYGVRVSPYGITKRNR